MIRLDLTHCPPDLDSADAIDRWTNTHPELAWPLDCVDQLEPDFEYWVGLVDEFGEENMEFEDDLPYIDLTVGVSDDGQGCGWQTGDNCFSGPAYHYPHWAVMGIGNDSTWPEVRDEIKSQIWELAELQSYDEWVEETTRYKCLHEGELLDLEAGMKEEGLSEQQIRQELESWVHERRVEDG